MTASVDTRLQPQQLRSAFAAHPAGVVAVAADIGGRYVGMVASSFVPVSLDPPLVSVCIQNTSGTWPVLTTSATLGISVLGSHHGDVARSLARRTGDRFENVPTELGPAGAVFIAASPLHLQVAIRDTIAAGDHHIVLLDVLDVRILSDHAPIVFYQSGFHTLRP
ncbi:flavin reductase family protein [Hoyosella rhizosphaerae]|uniref:Oxidoreductase n=1 Tax=Hoyosella rhizosphaerae TaxID=1755582 RepID=A0A916U1F8_9ACTN|nr:flavin reductase family protein [Hoyosella rhizosphaerae]MBN4927233.1 flavin reductase family protein [Hoyosella rhizosphaerae]GGC52929.1 oxidoreductase [Hoyosella rhizosphaerae]